MTQTLRFAIEAAPLEAGKRIRFHGFGRSNYRSREMGEALRILERAMILYLLYPTTGSGLPALPDLRKSPRLQLLVPVEVKAGRSGTLRSLHQFVDQAAHPWAVRLYAGPLRRDSARTQRGKEFQLLNLPYFLAGQIDAYLREFVG